MACECKDENGYALGMCLGICNSAIIQIQSNKRIVDLEEKLDKIFAGISSQIESRQRINQINEKAEWKDGFHHGFQVAREIYEERN